MELNVFGVCVCRVNENADSFVAGVCSIVCSRVHKHRRSRAAAKHGIHMHWLRPVGGMREAVSITEGRKHRNN